MAVNWALGLTQQNPGESFANAFQQGQQARQQNMAKAAMAALVQDPSNDKALEALASVDPGAAQQILQQRQAAHMKNAEQYKQAVLDGVPLYQQMGSPTDDAGWQRFKAAMAQTGHDVSQMPDHFMPEYVQGATQMYQAWSKPQPSDTQLVPFQQGGGVLAYNKSTHQVIPLVVPNPGNMQAGAPVAAGPPPEAIARLKANPHESTQFDEIFGPGASQKVLGAQTAPAPSGGF